MRLPILVFGLVTNAWIGLTLLALAVVIGMFAERSTEMMPLLVLAVCGVSLGIQCVSIFSVPRTQ